MKVIGLEAEAVDNSIANDCYCYYYRGSNDQKISFMCILYFVFITGMVVVWFYFSGNDGLFWFLINIKSTLITNVQNIISLLGITYCVYFNDTSHVIYSTNTVTIINKIHSLFLNIPDIVYEYIVSRDWNWK